MDIFFLFITNIWLDICNNIVIFWTKRFLSYANNWRLLFWCLTHTLLDAKAGGPLLQGDVVVAVSVALLEEAGGAMLHGNEGSTQGRELGVGEETGQGWDETSASRLVQFWV